ncbi:MAG: hypothetical protein N2442_09000 [Spirochaetes bacterium]|nr:hypothetical protein [Spirochaetota bacterium]
MKPILFLCRWYIPVCFKKRKLRELFELTADAFQCELPPLRSFGYEECLQEYARFSAINAGEVLTRPAEIESIKSRLYRNAFQMGESLRKSLGIKKMNDLLWVSKILYRILRIQCTTNQQGEWIIKKCFFSSYYSPGVCRILSSLDEGMAAGLSGGGRLTFHERITDGEPCCRATFQRAGEA